MTSLMKTRLHMAMGALWDIIAYDHDFARAKKMLLTIGIEGPTPSGLTPIDAALDAISGARTPEHKEIFYAAVEFIGWAFEHGAAPRVDYLSKVARMAGYPWNSGPKIKYVKSTESDWENVVDLAVISLLLDHHVPVELEEAPPPGEHQVPSDHAALIGRLSTEEGFSPLHYAAQGGSAIVTDYLLEKCNASIDKRSTYGMTPLLVACLWRRIEVVRTLLDHSADSTIRHAYGDDAMSLLDGTDEPEYVQIRDLLRLRERYHKGPIIGPSGDYRNDERIHRTARGDLVRSKSEVIIADALFYLGCDYQYEETLTDKVGQKVVPDFVIETQSGTCVWEHAGMMGNAGYREKWKRKVAWYEANGYTRDVNCFVTMEDGPSGIDSREVREIALRIKEGISKGT